VDFSGKATSHAASQVGWRGSLILERPLLGGVSLTTSVGGYVCSWKLYLDITSEEVTAKRRAERKQFKLDRAQAIAAAAAEAEAAFAEGRIISADETGVLIPSAATWKPSDLTRSIASPASESLQEVTDLSLEPLEDMEHMQLTLAEAFFLTWALDCLTICHPETVRPTAHVCAGSTEMFS